MTLEQLRIFIAVAERQHLTEGARAANLSPSAATAAIQALEGRHGAKLFHRVGRRLELSSAGAAFLPEAKAVLAAAAHAEAALQDLSGLRRGRLTLAASQTLASHWLPPLLVRFATAHEGIGLSLIEGNTATVSAAVLAGDAELGCIEGAIDAPALAALPLAADRLMIVGAPSHPLASEAGVSMARLATQRWVMRERGSGTRGIVESALAAVGIDPESLPIIMTFPTNEACCGAAAEGDCLTAVSELVAAPYVQAGRLRRIDHALPERRFLLLRHKERYRSQAALAFEDLLRRESEALAQRQRLADFEI